MAAKYANKRQRYQEDDRFRKCNSNVDRRRTINGEHGADLTDDEVEFGKAMNQHVRHHGQPDCRDVIQVLKSLGYRKDS